LTAFGFEKSYLSNCFGITYTCSKK
jgi:hypothetical protein